jgi:predicted negative regulator of RcsB-dependent stress response
MRYFVCLILLLGAVVGLGVYRGWFAFTTRDTAEQKKLTLQVQVDTDKIKEDAAAANKKVHDIGGTLTAAKTAHGTMANVNADHFAVMLEQEDEAAELSFQIDPTSKIRLNDRDVVLADLRVGDRVTVTFHEKGGKNVVRTVTAERTK